jgi:hypothetical protein
MPICSSVENAEKLRLAQLLSTDSEAFFCVAVSVLRSDDEDARRYILRLLICEGQFLRFLCSRSELCTAECTEIMRTAAKLLPTADLKLARHLCDQANELHRESLLKLLDVLGSISRPARLSTVVSKLLLHSDAIVRSKAARLMNLSEDERYWLIAEADDRVLANAVEALWDLDDSPSRTERYWRASKSPNARVASNALVGLYRAGEPEAPRLIQRMSEHAAPEFRRSAAWAMGETGDTQFLPALTRMLRAESGSVRANILRSLARIRRRAESAVPRERKRPSTAADITIH